jgi:hypothetical protein
LIYVVYKATVRSDTNTLGSDKQYTSVSLWSDRMSGGFLSIRRAISRMGRTMSVTDRYFKAWSRSKLIYLYLSQLLNDFIREVQILTSTGGTSTSHSGLVRIWLVNWYIKRVWLVNWYIKRVWLVNWYIKRIWLVNGPLMAAVVEVTSEPLQCKRLVSSKVKLACCARSKCVYVYYTTNIHRDRHFSTSGLFLITLSIIALWDDNKDLRLVLFLFNI